MKIKVFVFVGLITVCVSIPVVPNAVILRSISDVRPDGYEFNYETSDPIIRKEVGVLRQLSPGVEAIKVDGDFAFNFPDGLSLQTVFVADENGYRPKVTFGQGIGNARPVYK